MQDISSILQPVYGKASEFIQKELVDYAKTLPKAEILQTDPYWYKFMNLYFIYPDSVIYDKTKSPLANIELHLEHIHNLGCNALHILPFLDSPQVDHGFDISDYYNIRKDLGTFADLKKLVRSAQTKGIHLFMDIVFNHASDQIDWFKKAESGDVKYRNYFIHQKERPEFLKMYEKSDGVWADYIVNGKKISVSIVFPDRCGEIPHWRQGKDGYWYYHTFYPEQIDLNWDNPDVFIEMSKILLFWTSMHFNFRMDAHLFIGKGAYKQANIDNPINHMIAAGLRAAVNYLNPYAAMLVESYERVDLVKTYFGTSNKVEANLVYDFHMCTHLWVSLIDRDPTYIWNHLENIKDTPKHAEWLDFLRNHDELSLEHLSTDLLKQVQKELIPLGKSFRRDFGISGRTFSLLEHKAERFVMAYFLLASLPSGIIIPYGDELAKPNIPLEFLPELDKIDTRNINRGILSETELSSQSGKKMYENFAKMLKRRLELRDYMNIFPTKLPVEKPIFGARYASGTSVFDIYINLDNVEHKINVDTEGYQCILNVNTADLKPGVLELGPYGGIWIQK